MVFRASAARPPAEPVPATINAALAMHIGHIEFLVSLHRRRSRVEIDMPGSGGGRWRMRP
jgi:hypothetical protein